MEPLSTTTRTAVGAHDFSNEYPDMVLSPGSTLYDYSICGGTYAQFGVLACGQWWVWHNGQWIGYFPFSLWTNQGVNWTSIQQTNFSGEIVAQRRFAPFWRRAARAEA